MLDRSDVEASARYDEIWHIARPKLLSNEIRVDSLPEVGGDRWGISAVVRPALSSGVWSLLAEMEEELGGSHAYYDSSNIHVTLRSLEGYRGRIGAEDDVVIGYAETVREILREMPPFRIRFSGIVSTQSSLLLCGYGGAGLQRFRRELFSTLKKRSQVRSGPEKTLSSIRNLAHASLAVYGGPLVMPNGVVETIDNNRRREFGNHFVEKVEIVRYRRTVSKIVTETLFVFDR